MKWNGEMIICVLSKSLKISRWHGSAAWGERHPTSSFASSSERLNSCAWHSSALIGTSQEAHHTMNSKGIPATSTLF